MTRPMICIARTVVPVLSARFAFRALARAACLSLATCQTSSIYAPPFGVRLAIGRDETNLTRGWKEASGARV